MDVTADLREVSFLLDQVRFEAALEKVPGAAVPHIEVSGVAAVEQMHAGGEIGFGGLQK